MPRILIAALAGAGLIVGWLAGGGLEEVEAQAQTYGNSQAQTHSQGADIGRYRMIMQSGVWLLDTATGDTWQWKCPPENSTVSTRTGLTLCAGSYAWLIRQRNY